MSGVFCAHGNFSRILTELRAQTSIPGEVQRGVLGGK